MGLAVETPDPPDLTNRPLPSDLDPADVLDDTVELRRGELEEMLRDGAWNEAFQEWAEYADLAEAEYRAIQDADLVEALDFYWDPVDERLRFEVPSMPTELAEREGVGGDLATRAASELADLGQTVLEMLEDAYVDWGEAGAVQDVWTEETFDEDTTPED